MTTKRIVMVYSVEHKSETFDVQFTFLPKTQSWHIAVRVKGVLHLSCVYKTNPNTSTAKMAVRDAVRERSKNE